MRRGGGMRGRGSGLGVLKIPIAIGEHGVI